MLCYGSLSRLINTSSNPQVHPDCLRIVSFRRQNLSGPPRAHMDKGHASELRLQDPRGLTPASNAVSCDFSCPGTTSHPCHSKACFIPWGLWEEGGRSLATVSGAGSPSVWYGGDLGYASIGIPPKVAPYSSRWWLPTVLGAPRLVAAASPQSPPSLSRVYISLSASSQDSLRKTPAIAKVLFPQKAIF